MFISVVLAESLSGVRTIRDFTEGPSLLVPAVQDAIEYLEEENGGLTLRRRWFDNVTTSVLSFSSSANLTSYVNPIEINDRTATFQAGSYEFSAYFNYPQLDQLSPTEVLY